MSDWQKLNFEEVDILTLHVAVIDRLVDQAASDLSKEVGGAEIAEEALQAAKWKAIRAMADNITALRARAAIVIAQHRSPD